MKTYTHAIVIGVFGFAEKFVRVEIDGDKVKPMFYKSLALDRLIFDDLPMAMSMVMPQWIQGKWVEAAPYTACLRAQGLCNPDFGQGFDAT